MIQDDVAAAEVTSEEVNAAEALVAWRPFLASSSPVAGHVEPNGIMGGHELHSQGDPSREVFYFRDGDVEFMCGDTGFTPLHSQHFEMSFPTGTPPCANSRKQTTDRYGN